MHIGDPRTAYVTGLSAMACALVVSGCGMGDDVMATIGMSAPETTARGTVGQSFDRPPVAANGGVAEIAVTPAQQAYLDALTAAGVQPGSELSALSIGSYVCQARAADQSDQAVWDSVLPMVRGDVRDSIAQSVAPPVSQINATTANYIRIATDKLC